MVGRIVPPSKGVYIPISRTCRHVNSCGKRDFIHMIKLMILKWDITLSCPDRPNVITRVLNSGWGNHKKRIRDRHTIRKARSERCSMALKMEERSPELRNMSGLWKWEKARQEILSQSFQNECIPTDTLILAQWDPGWTSELQNYKLIDHLGFW